MLWIFNSCNVTSHVPTYTNIIITFHMCKFSSQNVLFYRKFLPKKIKTYPYIFICNSFFSYVAFIILYSPNSNLLDNVGVLLRLDSLCYVYSQTFSFIQIHLQQHQQQLQQHKASVLILL